MTEQLDGMSRRYLLTSDGVPVDPAFVALAESLSVRRIVFLARHRLVAGLAEEDVANPATSTSVTTQTADGAATRAGKRGYSSSFSSDIRRQAWVSLVWAAPRFATLLDPPAEPLRASS